LGVSQLLLFNKLGLNLSVSPCYLGLHKVLFRCVKLCCSDISG